MSTDETSTTTGIEPDSGRYVGKGFTEEPDTDAEGHGIRASKGFTEEPGIEPDDALKGGRV